MVDDDKGPGGADANPGGNSGDDQDKNKDKVDFDSHQKLLKEKKAQSEKLRDAEKRLADLEKAQKDRDEAELQKNSEFQKLAEQRAEELKEANLKLKSFEEERNSSKKLHAFLSSLQGKVDRQYWGLIDLDKVVIDPANGEIDDGSLKMAIKDFEKTYPEVIKRGAGGNKVPNDAARDGSAKLSYSAWLALPYKERNARMKEVDTNDPELK